MLTIDTIEDCKRNNRKAQLKLYNQYCDGLYIVAKRFLNYSFVAEVTFYSWFKHIKLSQSIVYIYSDGNASNGKTIVVNAKFSNVIMQ